MRTSAHRLDGHVHLRSGLADLSKDFKERIGHRIIHLREVDSTMDHARGLIADGRGVSELHGTVVLADQQMMGRGRFGRRWFSETGQDVLMSIVLQPRHAIVPLLTTMTSLAVADAIEEVTSCEAGIKWPNDIILGERKICGIIAEATTGQEVNSVIVGIGLNVNLDPEKTDRETVRATSIRDVLGRNDEVDRVPVVRSLLEHINLIYQAVHQGEDILAEWKARLVTLGESVTVRDPAHPRPETTITGIAEDIDQFGRLVIRDSEGMLNAVAAGEATIVKRR